jgi:hypothetical protein
MTDADVSQVRVGEFTAGIIGLKPVLEDMAERGAEKVKRNTGMRVKEGTGSTEH